MARLVTPVQVVGTAVGQNPPTPVEVTYHDASALGHEWSNTGKEIILFRVGSPGGGSLKIVSATDQFGRVGDVGPLSVAPGTTKQFGPYTPVTIWGDASSKGYADPSGLSGSVSIAILRMGF